MTPNTSPLLAYWGLTSTTWLVLWSVLAALTVLLVVLLRTRWSQAKPWRKCAILSLWVHVLLGCVATTVRIVTGAPELGNDLPIRVAVREVYAAEETEPIEEITPEWEQPTEPPLVAPEAEPLSATAEPEEPLKPMPSLEPSEPAPPLEAPALLETPAKPQASPEPVSVVSQDDQVAPVQPIEEELPSKEEQPTQDKQQPTETAAPEPAREPAEPRPT